MLLLNVKLIRVKINIMSVVKYDYLYTNDFQWIKVKNYIARVGLDEHCQSEFGEIVYVDLPKVGESYLKDEQICVIESVKTASDIYAPVSGKITRINDIIIESPNVVNKSCYDEGWLFEIHMKDLGELDNLLEKYFLWIESKKKEDEFFTDKKKSKKKKSRKSKLKVI